MSNASITRCPSCAMNASMTNHGDFKSAAATRGSCVASRRLRSVAASPRSTALCPRPGARGGSVDSRMCVLLKDATAEAIRR